MSDIIQCLTELNDTSAVDRGKALKLLSKILSNILNHPTEKKYSDINLVKIKKKFNKCYSCFKLLICAGFKQSVDNDRLNWTHNPQTFKSLIMIYNLITHYFESDYKDIIDQSIGFEFDIKDIIDAIDHLSDVKSKDIDQFVEYITNKQINDISSPQRVQQHDLHSSNAETLMELGFDRDSALIALGISNNNIDVAAQWLLFERNDIQNNNMVHSDRKCDATNECECVDRVIEAVIYYESLDVDKESNQDDVIRYFNETYTTLVDDYIHIITEHNNEINDICNIIYEETCTMTQCSFTTRHYERDNNKQSFDPQFSFCKEIMDSMHFYLFHLFESGLRTLKSGKEIKDETQQSKSREDGYFDAAFSRITETINERQHLTAHFNRFKSSNKFNIEIDTMDSIELKSDGNITFTDRMMQYLATKQVQLIYIKKCIDFVKYEEYDTDTMVNDLERQDGNIGGHITDQKCLEQIKKLIKNKRDSFSSFSIGIRWNYWESYKALDHKAIRDFDLFRTLDTNISIHDEITALYIEVKYASFKEEIGNYKHINWRQFTKVMVKANNYLTADIVLQTIAVRAEMCYGVTEGDICGLSNLISLILYTDYDVLSADFSSTFRKITPFEELSSIKARNREYYWWSKTLRETVEYFGKRAKGDKNKNGDFVNKMRGPFYTGISVVMTVPQFYIQLCGPTSTSNHIEVALKFSGVQGMIIQLNNDVYPSDALRGFICSWISRYPEEDERLFIGGRYPIRLESVRIRKTKFNYKNSFRALFYLDAMLTGSGNMGNVILTSKQCAMISSLIKDKLRERRDLEFSKYIYDTFDCFCQNKQKIILNLDFLTVINEDILDLIMYHIAPRDDVKDCVDKTNLFRPKLLNLFENAKKMVIYTHMHSRDTYALSVIGLLQLIESTSLEQVFVITFDKRSNMWIGKLWSLNSIRIQQQFNAKGYNISLQTGYIDGFFQETLVIDKLLDH